MATPHSPAATDLIWSVSPPLGARAKFATRPRAHSSALASPRCGSGPTSARGCRGGARAHADLALQLRPGKVLIVLHVFGPLRRLVGRRSPGRGWKRRTSPVAAQVGRNPLFQEFRFDRGKQADLVGLGEARGIDRDEHVGRAVGPLVADAFQEFVLLGLDAVDLDAGLRVKLAYRLRRSGSGGLNKGSGPFPGPWRGDTGWRQASATRQGLKFS
jgi:hypothetical protein